MGLAVAREYCRLTGLKHFYHNIFVTKVIKMTNIINIIILTITIITIIVTRLRPHLIMCNLHRSKLDANRPLVTAAEVEE